MLSLPRKLDNDYYPEDFPPQEFYLPPQRIEAAVRLAFADLLGKNSSETDADVFLRKHPALLGQCMNYVQSGHHGIWVVPQKLIDPGVDSGQRGLKPDYLLGGRGSDGYTWCVVEMKGPQDTIFKRKKDPRGTITFSDKANEGICQLFQYVDYCDAHQSYFRDHFKFKDFREVRGILIIGREEEVDHDKQLQNLKGAWNRASGSKLMIRTYDALLGSNTSAWAAVEDRTNYTTE